jgi:AacA4 family aminoglycoside N(6')-acetyltransferase
VDVGEAVLKLSDAPIILRRMTEADLPVLHDWRNRPHFIRWWGGEALRPTLADVVAHYTPRLLAESKVTPYIAMLGDEAVAYAQSYVAMHDGDGWWENVRDPGVRGIDQTLANEHQLGLGLGTRLVRALVAHLFEDPSVTAIQTDPAPDNLRAIRCYEKAGFVQQGRITTPDGPAIYMLQTRAMFDAASRAA